MTERPSMEEILQSLTKPVILSACELHNVTFKPVEKRTKDTIRLRLMELGEQQLNAVKDELSQLLEVKRAGAILSGRGPKRRKLGTEIQATNDANALTSVTEVLNGPFLTIPTETQRRALVAKFITRTGNEAVEVAVCYSCAREMSRADVRAIAVEDLPNPHLLEPHTPHPTHQLTNGLLLYRDPTTHRVPPTVCADCLGCLRSNRRPELSLSNDMWVGEVPFELSILSLPEVILVSRFHAAAYVVKLYPKKKSATWIGQDQLTSALRGNISTYHLKTEDVSPMVDDGLLPPRATILAATIAVTFIGRKNITLRGLKTLFTVQKARVANALRWLIANNQFYSHIKISSTNLESLPDNAVPEEILSTVKWSEDDEHVMKERIGYIPEHEDSDEDEDHHVVIEEQAEEDTTSEEDNDNEHDDKCNKNEGVFEVQASGVVDLEGNRILQSELIQHALQNLEGHSTLQSNSAQYTVRTGGYVNEYARRDDEGKVIAGTVEDPNHLLGSFPILFPYGCGGFETPRPCKVFGVLQKRAICSSAALKMTRGDFIRNQGAIENLKPSDFEQAALEESTHTPFSNPIWSLIAVKNPPNLWITLNPSDINNPITQVFAGEEIDLDNFDAKRQLNSKSRSQNIAKDPYAAAKFFHFVINATLECVFGITSKRGNIQRTKGIFGEVNDYRGSEVGYGPDMARDNSEVRSRVLACSTHWEWDVGEAISNTLHTLLVSPGIMARVQDWYEQPKWGS
ncbi:hypothetical protein F5877DRAFT_72947 [Lentinula edodes]|nr:hypothetical protein F5877DRAFT_72947 [Lentinula edodes]